MSMGCDVFMVKHGFPVASPVRPTAPGNAALKRPVAWLLALDEAKELTSAPDGQHRGVRAIRTC